MANNTHISNTTRNVLYTLARLGTATISDFSVIQQKRNERNIATAAWRAGKSSWGHSLLTQGTKCAGWKSSLIHRGLVKVVGKNNRGANIFMLTDAGWDMTQRLLTASPVCISTSK